MAHTTPDRRLRRIGIFKIPAPNYGHQVQPLPKQDVVSIDIIPDRFPERHTTSQTHLDNSHTIEVAIKDTVIRIHNDADPVLLTRILRMIQETLC